MKHRESHVKASAITPRQHPRAGAASAALPGGCRCRRVFLRSLAQLLVLLTLTVLSACRRAPTPTKSTTIQTCPPSTLQDPVVGINLIDWPNGDGQGYGTPISAALLDEFVSGGINGLVLPVEIVATHANEPVVEAGARLASKEGRQQIEIMIRQAKTRGFVVVVVPHLIVRDGTWRGYLFDSERQPSSPEEPSALAAFGESYRQTLTPLIALAERACADVFSIGIELRAIGREPKGDVFFQNLLEHVRDRFNGRLAYSANWDEVEAFRHWHDVDIIGVNSFHPLHDGRSTATVAMMQANAVSWQKRFVVVKARFAKPLWILETGFKATSDTAVEPWLWPAQVANRAPVVDEDTQRQSYGAVLGALSSTRAASAVFFWNKPVQRANDRGERYEPDFGFGFWHRPVADDIRAFAKARSLAAPSMRMRAEPRRRQATTERLR